VVHENLLGKEPQPTLKFVSTLHCRFENGCPIYRFDRNQVVDRLTGSDGGRMSASNTKPPTSDCRPRKQNTGCACSAPG